MTELQTNLDRHDWGDEERGEVVMGVLQHLPTRHSEPDGRKAKSLNGIDEGAKILQSENTCCIFPPSE